MPLPIHPPRIPSNMLGFVAHNVLDGMVSLMDWSELDQLMDNPEKKGYLCYSGCD